MASWCIRMQSWEFPVGPVVRTMLWLLGPRYDPQEGELRSGKPCTVAKGNKRKKRKKERMQSLSVCWKHQVLTT